MKAGAHDPPAIASEYCTRAAGSSQISGGYGFCSGFNSVPTNSGLVQYLSSHDDGMQSHEHIPIAFSFVVGAFPSMTLFPN